MTKVVIAESREIVCEGLKNMLEKVKSVEVSQVVASSNDLHTYLENHKADVVVLNYCANEFKVEDIPIVQSTKTTKVLAIAEQPNKEVLQTALNAGVAGHILLCCDSEEISDAISALKKGERFFCGKVLDAINNDDINAKNVSCAPVSLSKRELEIIAMIAEGATNKDIADQLFLSTHTIMTHRKNIMNKLGVKNTAGIVVYAVKENVISPNKYLFSPNPVK